MMVSRRMIKMLGKQHAKRKKLDRNGTVGKERAETEMQTIQPILSVECSWSDSMNPARSSFLTSTTEVSNLSCFAAAADSVAAS